MPESEEEESEETEDTELTAEEYEEPDTSDYEDEDNESDYDDDEDYESEDEADDEEDEGFEQPVFASVRSLPADVRGETPGIPGVGLAMPVSHQSGVVEGLLNRSCQTREQHHCR